MSNYQYQDIFGGLLPDSSNVTQEEPEEKEKAILNNTIPTPPEVPTSNYQYQDIFGGLEVKEVPEDSSYKKLTTTKPEDLLNEEINKVNIGTNSILDGKSEEQADFESSIESGAEEPSISDITLQYPLKIESIASIIKKYENASDSLERVNNLYAIKFGNRAEKYGAIDSGIPSSDGGTFAAWPDAESMELGSQKVIEEMLLKDADGDVKQFISNYIGQPIDSQEVETRYSEIMSAIAEPPESGAEEPVESREEKILRENEEFYVEHPIESLELAETPFTTQYGRKVYRDQFGAHHSEITTTMDIDVDGEKKYINIPIVFNGKIVSDKEAYDIVHKFTPEGEGPLIDPETGEEFILYNSIDEAVKGAEERMMTMNNLDQPWNQPYTQDGIIYNPSEPPAEPPVEPKSVKIFDDEEYQNYINNLSLQKELESKFATVMNVDIPPGSFSRDNVLDFKTWKSINNKITKHENRKNKKRNEVVSEALLDEDFELKGANLKHFEFTQDVNVADEDKNIIREFLNYELNTSPEERLSYKEWKKEKGYQNVANLLENGIELHPGTLDWVRTGDKKGSVLYPSDDELEDMVNLGYIDESYLEPRRYSVSVDESYFDPFGLKDRKYETPDAMLSANREYLKARILYLTGQPPGSFDELPEEFWSSETAKGLLVNSYATLYELPMIPFEMVEPTGESIQRFLVTGKKEDFWKAVEEPFKLVYSIGEFFAHQTANLSFVVSPFATEEQKQEGLNALYNDPVAPILAVFGIRHGVKSLESLPNVSSAVISKANMNLAKFKHAYEYYKSGKKAPKELLEYVEILEKNEKVRTITEEQLALDLKKPVEEIKKKEVVEETKLEETKLEETKVEETKVEEVKPIEEPKVEEVKPEEVKIEPKKEEVKPEEVKVEEVKVEKPKVKETKSVDERIEALNAKGFDNLSTNERILLNKLENVRKRKIEKEKIEQSKTEKTTQKKREKGKLEYRLKELEDSLIAEESFISPENVKSRVKEIEGIKKTIRNLDKELNTIVELHGGFDFITPLFGKKGPKGVSEAFLKWLRVKNDKGKLIKDGQLDIFDYIDETVHQGRFKSLLSYIDEKIQASTYPVNLKKVPDVNKYYELRGEFFGKGYVAEMYVNKILKDWKNYSSADLKQMYDVLNGTADIKTITNPQLLKETNVVRTLIDELGQSLVDRNLLSKEAFESHKGNYIARIYEVYLHDKKNLTRFDDIPSIRRKYKFTRKDLGPEQKTALGEITDPSIPFSETVARSLTDIFANDLMQQVLNNPKWAAKGGFIELKNGLRYGEGYLRELHKNTLDFIEREKRSGRKVSPETEAMYKEITEALDKYDANPPVIDKSRFELAGKEYGILQGAYVDKGILRDFDVMRGDVLGVREAKTRPGKYIQNTRKFLTNWFKASKVALNLPTIGRNVISATMQSAISGTGYYKQVKLIKPTIEGFLTKNKDWMNAAEHGLFRGNWTSGELKFADRWSRELTQQVKDGVPYHEALVNLASKYLGKGKKAGAHVIGFYGKIDNYFKYTKYLDEIARGKSPAEAVRLAQDALFDYSMVSPGVAMTREYFPFTTFFTKSIAFTVKNLRNHPGKAGLVIGTPIAYKYFDIAEKTLKEYGDVSDEKYNAYLIANNKNLSEGGFITLPTLDENGNFQTINLSMMQPHGAFFDIGGKLSHLYYADSIDDVLSATGDAAKETVSNYSLNPVPVLALAATYGVVRTRNGTYEIFSPLDDNRTKIEKYSAFVRDLFSPSFLGGGDAGLIGEYLEIDSQSILASDRTPNQIASSIIGINIYPVDITRDITKGGSIRAAKSSEIQKEHKKELKKILLDIRLTEKEKDEKKIELSMRYFLMELQLIDEFMAPAYEKQLIERYGTNTLKGVFEKEIEKVKTLK